MEFLGNFLSTMQNLPCQRNHDFDLFLLQVDDLKEKVCTVFKNHEKNIISFASQKSFIQQVKLCSYFWYENSNETFLAYFQTLWASGHILNLSWPQKKLFFLHENSSKIDNWWTPYEEFHFHFIIMHLQSKSLFRN